jgi:multidrug resistance protein, MATE family
MSERDPLLKGDARAQAAVQEGTIENYDKPPTHTRQVLTEFWIILKNALPVIGSYVLQNSIQTGSVFVVGRTSPLNLSVAAFSYMFAMATIWLLGLGGTTAIDTLASSLFSAARDKTRVGVVLQRAGVVLAFMYIPFAILWFFSAGFLRLLKQEEDLADLVQEFLRVLLPGAVGYVAFEALKKYLQAQNIMQAGSYVLLITSPLNLGLNYLMVHTFGMGLLGAPLATGITYWLSFGLLVLYTWKIDGSQCWGGFSRDAFKELWPMTKLASNGVLMIGTEWWSFEIITIVAGQLGGLDLPAQSVVCTADQILNTIPFGCK